MLKESCILFTVSEEVLGQFLPFYPLGRDGHEAARVHLTALRRGEDENCILCRGESSCILPINKAAVHTNPLGSRLAVKHFSEYLTEFPDDLELQWLLNLAHMTLGEYPGKSEESCRLTGGHRKAIVARARAFE